MKKIFIIKVVGSSKRIRIPKGTYIKEGSIVSIEVVDENTILIKKLAESQIDWIKNIPDIQNEWLKKGIDLSFKYL